MYEMHRLSTNSSVNAAASVLDTRGYKVWAEIWSIKPTNQTWATCADAGENLVCLRQRSEAKLWYMTSWDENVLLTDMRVDFFTPALWWPHVAAGGRLTDSLKELMTEILLCQQSQVVVAATFVFSFVLHFFNVSHKNPADWCNVHCDWSWLPLPRPHNCHFRLGHIHHNQLDHLHQNWENRQKSFVRCLLAGRGNLMMFVFV